MLTYAHKVGVSQGQMERFLRGGYIPQMKQLDFHAEAHKAQTTIVRYISQGGTRSSAKTHTALAQVLLDDCQRCPGLKVLFLRKIQKAAKESFEDVIAKVLWNMEYKGPGADGILRFPNGSRVHLGGYKDPSDIDKYLGIEYDLIVIEEATQLPEEKVNRISGSLRTTRSDWRTCMYMTYNPEGVGLQWAREQFVIPWREGREAGTVRRFIFSTYKDNKHTDPDYVLYLESLPGALGEAWREGNFDVYMGMAFPNFRDEIHIIKPFPIPDYWYMWVSVDDGYADPFCALWFAKDPITRRVYVVREAYQALLTNSQQANLINDYTDRNWTIKKYIGDPQMFVRSHRNKVHSAADEYKRHGILLRRGENNRILGKRAVDEMLSIAPDGLPKMQIFDECPNLAAQLKNLVFDPNKPEDTDQTMEDHAYDTARYGLLDKLSRPGNLRNNNNNRYTRNALDGLGAI